MSTIASLDVALGMNVGGFVSSASKARGAMTDLGAIADKVFRENMTTSEQYQEKLAQLNGLHARGQISTEVYGRAIRKLRDEMSGAAAKAAEFARNAAAKAKEEMAAAARQAAAYADAMRRGEQVTRSMMTPLEAYVHRMHELAGLLRQGAINQQTYARAASQAVGQMRAASATTSNVGSTLSQSLLGFAGPVGAAIVGISMLKQGINELSRATAAGATHALKLAAAYEQAEIAFTTVFKSAELARKTLAEVVRFADLTPFEFPELKDAATKLAGFGIQAQQIVPTLRMLGDLAAGTGANIGELATTYGKARIAGRAFSRDIYEFSNRGIGIQEALAKQFGVTKDKIMGLVEAGAVGFPEIQQALRSLTEEGGMFEGGLARQSQSLSGLFSTLTDSANASFRELGIAIARDIDLKALTRDAIDLADVFKSDATPVVAEFVKGLALMAKTANDINKSVAGLDLSFAGIGHSLRGVHAVVLSLQNSVSALMGDNESIAKRNLELLEIGKRAAGVGGAEAPGKVEIEQRGPDTSMIESVQKLNAELEKQIKTFGMSAEQIKVWELAQQGATREQLAYAAAAQQQLAAMKQQEEAAKKLQKAIESLEQKEFELVDGLRKQIATFNMSAEAAKVWELQMAGGDPAVVAQAQALARHLEALKAQKKAFEENAKAAKKAHEDMAQQAKQVIESTRTPLEKFAHRIDELQKMLDAGLINRETAIRAAKEAFKDLPHAEAKGSPRALLRGSAEAFSATIRAGRVDREATLRKQQLKEAQEAARHLRQINERQKKQQEPLVINNFQ